MNHYMEFKRKVYSDLLEWKETDHGTTAALIEGARRVGKTTVAEQFGKKEYRSYILIDFSITDKAVSDLFENFSGDLDDFFMRLQFHTGKELYERQSLVIFDEIQLYPKARQMIKHLVADGRYDYIETGSLISVKKNVEDILIPSEEVSIKMYPMDFEEFLWSMGDTTTMDLVRDRFASRKPLGRYAHEAVMRQYRLYMILGGMPQVIDRYLNEKSLKNIERTKRSIIDLYRNDMMKLPQTVSSRALSVFDSIPSILSSKKKILMPSKVKKNTRMRDYSAATTWLSEAMLVNVCRCQTDPSITIGMDIDDSRIKPYLLDTGLLISLAFGNDSKSMESVYDNLLRDKLSINEGMFFENAVAQELARSGRDLVFSEFRMKGSTSLYEVDFILPGLKKICPIDVKSSNSGSHRSMDVFRERFKNRVDTPVIIHSKDLRVDGDLLYIPIYMTMLL